MKYYINEKPKNDFYFLGELTPTGFIEGHGCKFIKEYLGEFPFLLDEIFAVDEANVEIDLHEFFNRIKK